MGFFASNQKVVGSKDLVLKDNSNAEAFYASQRKITNLYKEGAWAGSPAYIIGGGPSAKKVKPSQLNGKHTIALNRSFERFDNAEIWYGMDLTYYRDLVKGNLDKFSGDRVYNKWITWKGNKVFLNPTAPWQFPEPVYFVRRLPEMKISKSIYTGIYGGNNVGTGAIMLAIAMGANPIYLIGYDLKVSGDTTHHHTGYPKQDYDSFVIRLNSYKDQLERLSQYLALTDIKVINLNPDSALEGFEKKTVEEVLK